MYYNWSQKLVQKLPIIFQCHVLCFIIVHEWFHVNDVFRCPKINFFVKIFTVSIFWKNLIIKAKKTKPLIVVKFS